MRTFLAFILSASLAVAGGVSNPGGGGSTFTGGTVTSTITSTAATPLGLTYGGGSSGGNSIVSQTNETAVPRPGQSSQALGNFGLFYTPSAASNGAGRRDNIWQWGYNIPSSTGYQSNDDTFCLTLENSYTTGSAIRQGEFYTTVVSGDGVMNVRPFGITPQYDNHSIDANMRVNTFEIGWLDGTLDWAQFQSTASTGVLAFTGNSKVTFGTTNADVIYGNGGGTALLGYNTTAGAVRIGAGLTTTNFFGDNNVADGYSLTLGKLDTSAHNRGLRWNGTNGWQFQTGDSTWQNFGLPLGYYVSGNAGAYVVGVGPASYTPGDGTSTFEVYDATASTGITRQTIRAGAGQAGTLLNIVTNGQSSLWSVDNSGTMKGTYFREAADAFALQTTFDSTNVLQLGSGKTIAWSEISTFPGTLSTKLSRATTGVVQVTNALKLTPVTIANLPGTPSQGMLAAITDGDSSLAWGATAVNSGSGATKYTVNYNGTNWTVMGK